MCKFRILVFVEYTEEVTREYWGLQSPTVHSFILPFLSYMLLRESYIH